MVMESEFITVRFSTYAATAIFLHTIDGGKLFIKQPTPDQVSADGTYLYSPQQYHEPSDVILSFALGWQDPEQRYSFEPVDNICYCRTRVADADGNCWEARSLFSPDTLLQNVQDLERNNSAHLFDQSSPEWQQAFEQHILLTGIYGFYDDRFYRQLIVGEQIHELLFKYQYPTFDIAWLPAPDPLNCYQQPTLLVRVSNFKINSEVNGDEELPPFVYEINCETLMFYAQSNGLPRPLLFQKVVIADQPQPLVQYLPHGMPPSASV
jgi:hypothetical protein